MDEKAMSQDLLSWYDKNRRVLPWRELPTPYHVLVSELMLQQTRVETVKAYYDRMMRELPTLHDLAICDEGKLMKLWQGLGYYSRARHLQEAAKKVEAEFHGEIPSSKEELLSLPGIGPYTAGAILSIAYGKKEIAPDGNAYRIFARLMMEEGEIDLPKVKKRLEESMWKAIDEKRPGAWNQAIMDLGAKVCLSHGAPLCETCPIAAHCEAYQTGRMLDYPKRKAKKARRKEEKTVFLFQCQDRILLQKRNANGLLANLWGLPMADGKWNLGEVIEKFESSSFEREPIPLGDAVHIFSHIEWHMRGFAIFLKPYVGEEVIPFGANRMERQWVTRKDIDERFAIPSAFHHFLDVSENG